MKSIITILVVAIAALSVTTDLNAQAVQGANITSLSLIEGTFSRPQPFDAKGSTMVFGGDFLKSVNSEPAGAAAQDSWADKMGSGVINVTTAWVELPKEITDVSERHNILAGWTVGLGRGMVLGLVRGTAGVIDVATFGVPPYNKPAMKPAYTVQKPEEGFKIEILKW